MLYAATQMNGAVMCRRLLLYLTMLLVGATTCSMTRAEEFSSFAFVQENGSLKIDGRLVYLYGIYIPPTDQTCYTFVRPIQCSSRAALALDFKISGDFVRCQSRYVNPDGSVVASCISGGDDLSEWMLQRGWALASPDAPFSYTALERIAQVRGLGIWGIPIEIQKRRP
jgi:endonuclease YncB( thermonuclease family)